MYKDILLSTQYDIASVLDVARIDNGAALLEVLSLLG